MSADTPNTVASDETGPVVPERVERDKPPVAVAAEKKIPKKAASKKEPAAAAVKKSAKKEATAPAEAPKKRGRPKGSKNKVKKDAAPTAAPTAAPKKRRRPKGSTNDTKKVKASQGRKGRQWPVLPFALYINVQTRQPKALAIAIRKTLWKYTLRGPRNKGESAE